MSPKNSLQHALAFICLIAVGLALDCGLATRAQAQLKGTQTEGTIAPIPIAVPLFVGDDPQLAANVSDVLQADLERSGLFRPLDRASFLEQIRDVNAVPRFGDWWNPAWRPSQRDLDAYECRHGMGYTVIAGERSESRSAFDRAATSPVT